MSKKSLFCIDFMCIFAVHFSSNALRVRAAAQAARRVASKVATRTAVVALEATAALSLPPPSSPHDQR